MKLAPIPENDDARLKSLEDMEILSTPREADLDRITRTAQRYFNTEIALISLVDKERQWFKSRYGIDVTETPRDISFCGHAIMGDDTFVVENATGDERFCDNPLVTEGPEIRFYAGQPLTNTEGFRIGTLCVISAEPREVSQDDREVLMDLGRMIEIVLENRSLSAAQEAILQSFATGERDDMIHVKTGLWNERGLDKLFETEIARSEREGTALGLAYADVDDLQLVNDEFGRIVGDEVLRRSAAFLSDISRATDIVSYIGDGKFAVLLSGADPEDLQGLGEKYLRSVGTFGSFKSLKGLCRFTMSFGLASTGKREDWSDAKDELINAASTALRTAMSNGRNRFEIREM